jgi:hypothetical protein
MEDNKENSIRLNSGLNQIWLKAAVVGGIWASIEIIIGSFFHNLRLPFAGTMLAANSTVLMIAFYQIWPEKGLIWRAGLITALMKSISPSAVILGPMVGILTEAFLVEFCIRIFGNGFLSLSLAGALSVSSALIHKMVSLLILYGFNIVSLYVNIFDYLARLARIEDPNPWSLLVLALSVYGIIGVASAWLGRWVGIRSNPKNSKPTVRTGLSHPAHDVLRVDPHQKFLLPLFYLHVLIIPSGLFLVNQISLPWAALFVGLYTLGCLLFYGNSLRRLRKPVFWGQLVFLTFLAAVFWNGFRSEGSLFDAEGLVIGLEMNLRAVFVVVAFSSFGIELRNPVIRDFLFRKGFDKIYAALGLSFSALPVMIEAMPRPVVFLRYPIRSFSEMICQAGKWLQVFENVSLKSTYVK